MKSTLLTCLLGCSLAIPMASAATLVYSEDFESSGNYTPTADSTVSLVELTKADNTTALNFGSTATGDPSFSSGSLTLPTLDATDESGAFTIGFHFYYKGNVNNQDVLELYFSGTDNNGSTFTGLHYKLELNNGGKLALWTDGSTDTLGLSGKALTQKQWGNAWYYVALTFDGSTVSGQVVDVNGTYPNDSTSVTPSSSTLLTAANSTASYTLTSFSCDPDSVSGNEYFLLDNIAVYNGALSAADVAYLARNTAPATIPEPATATLSLLALAGLAARRRRK